MKIAGDKAIAVNGVILTGYYTHLPTGVTKLRLFELSSPSFGIQNFFSPYDAVLPTSQSIFSGSLYSAVGKRIRSSSTPLESNTSGAFYYSGLPELIGTCHGWGRDAETYYSGFNFYNAFYPIGYFTPPFGETTTLLKLNKDERDNLSQGACGQLSITEYNEQFGIISKVAPDADVATDTLTPGSLAQIMSLKETCPESTVAVTTYYEEVQANRIPGTASSLAAPTLYNHNAIPTSLDNYDNWVDGRYSYTTDEEAEVNKIAFDDNLRPVSNYPSGDTNHSRLNNTLCYAQLFETDTIVGRLTNGLQRIETPDILYGGVGSQVSAAGQEPWHYWHFLFRENSEMIPFFNYFKQIREGVTHRTISEGTQLFTPILSSEDYYWQNRQCPDTVDFLPWNFGASIYACPSEHFDVPYYAAIKKFGFYGTRFLNSCSRLNLDYTWSGVDNSLELEPQAGTLDIPLPDTEPIGIDTDGSWSFSAYDNLLRTAKTEEQYSNMSALNKGFFLWANTGHVVNHASWQTVIGYPGFSNTFWTLVNQFSLVYPSGLLSFISGSPTIIAQEQSDTSAGYIVTSGAYSDLLFSNEPYNQFHKQLITIVSGAGLDAWQTLEDSYAYYVSDGSGNIDEEFYRTVLSGREKRIRTRFFENLVRGNPIDLFPMNHVFFSTDNAREYLESTGWGRSATSFGKGSRLPPIQRRYFEGAYGNSYAISGVVQAINALGLSKNASFYPGFFNAYGFGNEAPTPYYVSVSSGYIRDTSGHKFSTSGWLALGYNEVGALDKNFSCFTPIITQQPLKKVFCKIGQRPTLRISAVDYHSIPEDKISYRYPEIVYWAHKLKICDDSFNNNYPLKYRWFRIRKSSYATFEMTADFSLVDFASNTGTWCGLEGDNQPTCTIIHPTECEPEYNSSDSNDYTFIQGTKLDVDDDYYYQCLVVGRFGVRMSEPSELVIEDWVRFDVSHKNGMNAPGQITIDFIINDKDGIDNTISFEAEESVAYKGYQQDVSAIPESVIEQKIPPPNAGFGDVSATRFIGPHGYVGATRSFMPDTLKDTRGLREQWGRFLEYGSLIQFSKRLSQHEGNLLYGYKHLPTCSNYAMSNGEKGIRVETKVNGYLVSHWTLSQQAYASLDNNAGMKWTKVGGIGSLYPPATYLSDITSPNMGIGHWQWGNNLGAIKRFGWLSQPENNDIVLIGQGVPSTAPAQKKLIDEIKRELITPTTLAGTNCGYTKYGLGRNMLYYIEAYDRFYLICDPIKKKNVANKSFMCPGLRHTNSSIQYFWLGQPHNTYLERRAMFGPYAYQWRVRRHNRDRNGNGMSEGFYSMGYNTRYELMYDAPAIYGLYVKRAASSEYLSLVNNVRALRNQLFPDTNIVSLRTWWFGEAGSEGTARRYGNFTFSCDTEGSYYNSDMCAYVDAAKALANGLDFRAYSCPETRLVEGECFDPCLSIRYSHGFFPGGKAQTMFGYTPKSSVNLETPKNLRLVATANFDGNTLITEDEQSVVDKNVYFRSPVNTPHARVWRRLKKIGEEMIETAERVVGISPCQDGGSDHCNYITPTLHMDSSSQLIGQTTTFINGQTYAANIYQSYDVRGND